MKKRRKSLKKVIGEWRRRESFMIEKYYHNSDWAERARYAIMVGTDEEVQEILDFVGRDLMTEAKDTKDVHVMEWVRGILFDFHSLAETSGHRFNNEFYIDAEITYWEFMRTIGPNAEKAAEGILPELYNLKSKEVITE